MNNENKSHLDQHLLVFSLCLAAPIALYFCRHLDDNRLTSWQWVFGLINISTVYLPLAIVLGLAWLLSRYNFYEKNKPLVLFVAAFGMASCFWSAPEVIVDASRYFSQAKHLELYGVGYFTAQWGKTIFAWTDLPLVPFLYGCMFKIFGEQRIFIQAFNGLMYAFTVLLTYKLGKTLWDEDTGFRGGLLLLGIPYLFSQVPLLLVDVPTMFFFMLAVVATVLALEKGGTGSIVLASLALSCVFYAKYSTWILLTLIPIIYLYFIFINPARAIGRGVVIALAAATLIGVVFLIYRDIFLPQIDFLFEYQKPGLKRWSESLFSTFLFQVHPFITAAALFAFWPALRRGDFRFIIVSFLLLLFLFMQVKRIRYTMPVFPMLALMGAYGLGAILNKKLVKHLVFSVVGTSFIIAFMGYLPFLKTLGVQNLQAAGKYINTIPANTVEVISLAGENAVVGPATAVPLLDIYTNKRLVYEDVPFSRKAHEQIETSPLRFTWEFPVPEYYSSGQVRKDIDALVLIVNDSQQPLPQSIETKTLQYPLQKTFHQTTRIFQHQTFVTVYHK